MSRTIRRKHVGVGPGKRPYTKWMISRYNAKLGRYEYPEACNKYDNPYFAEAKARFHSDSRHRVTMSVPSWFRRMVERKRRSKSNQEIRKLQGFFKDIIEEYQSDNVNLRYRRDIKWEYY